MLRRLEGDRTLDGVTHLIIDEVHERSEERLVTDMNCDTAKLTETEKDVMHSTHRHRSACTFTHPDQYFLVSVCVVKDLKALHADGRLIRLHKCPG